MGKIKLGFVGTGYMGQKAHLLNYVVLDDCEVTAIAEPRTQLAQKVADRYGIKNVFKDHKELLANCDVDAIVSIQPYRHNALIVPDILMAKKPLLTEKPISLSIEAGERLASIAEQENILYMVGYHKRSDPAMEYTKGLIEEWKASGKLGKMRYVRITMPPGDWIGGAGRALASDEPYPNIKTEPDVNYFDGSFNKRYDVFVNYYIHQVNALRYIFGEPYQVTFADKSGVLLVAESRSGICGVIEMAPYSNTIDWQEAYFICFEKGYIKVELPAPLACQQPGMVTVMEDGEGGTPITYSPSLPRISAMQKQAKNFIAALKGERNVTCDAREAVEDLKIARDYIAMMM